MVEKGCFSWISHQKAYQRINLGRNLDFVRRKLGNPVRFLVRYCPSSGHSTHNVVGEEFGVGIFEHGPLYTLTTFGSRGVAVTGTLVATTDDSRMLQILEVTSPVKIHDSAVEAEDKMHGDLLTLNQLKGYLGFSARIKARLVIVVAVNLKDVDFYIKFDDDVHTTVLVAKSLFSATDALNP
ncbi:hypothetical protein VNO77_04474 [Canavalia gladiata]|uniref:Hexosyltransferase n=1 Tax=Canavalia gladiata TaxID=3824 RepID=A0AAN9N337_CANGL